MKRPEWVLFWVGCAGTAVQGAGRTGAGEGRREAFAGLVRAAGRRLKGWLCRGWRRPPKGVWKKVTFFRHFFPKDMLHNHLMCSRTRILAAFGPSFGPVFLVDGNLTAETVEKFPRFRPLFSKAFPKRSTAPACGAPYSNSHLKAPKSVPYIRISHPGHQNRCPAPQKRNPGHRHQQL